MMPLLKKLCGPKNARYTHHTIQNELNAITVSSLLKDISKEISDAGCFAIAVDESKVASKTEQLSFVIRYVYAGDIREEFIGFQKAEGLNAASLK